MKIRRLSALALLSLSLSACGGSGGPAGSSPTITAISPDIGLAAGGTTVTVTGSNFKAGVSVKFGSTLSTAVNVTSATTLTAVSPAVSVSWKFRPNRGSAGRVADHHEPYSFSLRCGRSGTR